jgi:hypothetical protein
MAQIFGYLLGRVGTAGKIERFRKPFHVTR